MTSTPHIRELQFSSAPPALTFMLSALAPSPGLTRELARIAATWRDCRFDPSQFATFRTLCGDDAGSVAALLYPQVIGFRLNMAVLTHPGFPLPIWNALQVRNVLVQHAPFSPGAHYTLRTEVTDQRILRKGAEIDLATSVGDAGQLIWRAENTFFYRGSFAPAAASSTDVPAPRDFGETRARWRTPADTGWTMARLTGDYNGVHLWDAYARAFGFPRAFHHPQLMIAQCLARLAPRLDVPQELRVWLKGPAPYGHDVRLDARELDDGTTFALFAEEERPATIGHWRRIQ